MQLTGVRILDPDIQALRSTKDVLRTLIARPKLKKLAESLEQKLDLSDLPNVKIAQKRITMLDKEKAVGRWSLIEEELTRRNLPVPGTDDSRRAPTFHSPR